MEYRLGSLMSGFAPGILLQYFGYSLLLALPISLVLLARYRQQLLRGMLSTGGEAPVAHAEASRAQAGAAAESPLPSVSRTRLVVLNAVAAVAAATLTTWLYLVVDSLSFNPIRGLTIGYPATWPLAATLPTILALPRWLSLLLSAGWCVLGAALVVGCGLIFGAEGGSAVTYLTGYTTVLAHVALVPWLIVWVTGSRKLRPVSPIVLAGLLVFSFGSFGVQRAFIATIDHESLRPLLLRIPRIDSLWFLLAALPLGWTCWILLRWLSRQYEAKKFSDTQLLVDTWWLIAAFVFSTYLSTEVGWRGLVGLTAFAAYRLTMEMGFRLWPLRTSASGRRRLLLLRVFGFRRRTEQLFDAIAQRWRFSGSVNLIAGTDLAGRTVDPGEMIRFLAGNINTQFVRDQTDLARRLETLDTRPDPDGRFRFNDISCRDDTWKPTLEGLLDNSDLVLMDLRGFSQKNSGCRFELEKLAQSGRLPKTLFVVDKTTDVELLQTILSCEPHLNLARVERQSSGRLAALHSRLLALVS